MSAPDHLITHCGSNAIPGDTDTVISSEGPVAVTTRAQIQLPWIVHVIPVPWWLINRLENILDTGRSPTKGTL